MKTTKIFNVPFMKNISKLLEFEWKPSIRPISRNPGGVYPFLSPILTAGVPLKKIIKSMFGK